MPIIEDYAFGRIRIDGVDHQRDVIVLPERVYGPWWRAEGHELIPADLAPVRGELPGRLVVGTGSYGRMVVPQATLHTLSEWGIGVETLPTPQAVERLRGESAGLGGWAAALHLTC